MQEKAIKEIKEIAASDHKYLAMSIKSQELKVAQLNIAQYGVLKIFPGDELGTFIFSPIFRRPEYLVILHDNKQEIHDHIVLPLLAVANSADFTSMAERNARLESVSKNLIPVLQELGFPVSDVKMGPLLAFNPGVNNTELWTNASNYIAGPSFWYEKSDAHTARIEAGYETLLGDMPSIAAAQEVQFGSSFGINFTDLHRQIMTKYSDYNYINTSIKNSNNYMTYSVIYYNKNILEDITAEHSEELELIKSDFKNKLGVTDDRLVVCALRHLKSGLVYTVVNVHANYGKANNKAVYEWLNELFKEKTNFIVAGDFNLQAKNIEFSKLVDTSAGVEALWELTPEPADIANPTFDAILIK